MAEHYVRPEDVKSPRRYWRLLKVLYDTGENGFAVAIGHWEDEPALVMRWNGNRDGQIGNPQSRGLPTWFVVPVPLQKAVFQAVEEKGWLTSDAKAIAVALFPELKS